LAATFKKEKAKERIAKKDKRFKANTATKTPYYEDKDTFPIISLFIVCYHR